MPEVDGPVPPDVHQIDLIALLLQCGQGAADGRVLQRGRDDVPARMAGELRQTLEGEVVGLAGPGGVDDLCGLCAQKPRDVLGGVVDDQLGLPPGLMAGIRVAGAAALHLTKALQHPGGGGGVGGVVEIYHKRPFIIVWLLLFRLPPPALRPTAAIGYIIVWNAAYFKAVSPQPTENHRKIQEKGCQCPAFMLYYAEE